jgi:CxxC motif-containing protein (DUF1111 family)
MKGIFVFLLLGACQPLEKSATPISATSARSAPAALVSTEQRDLYLNAGSGTVFDSSQEAYSHRLPDMNEEHRTAFFSGESLFDQNWIMAPSSTVARDGLGPLYNARGCAACHVKDGRGKPFDDQGQSLEALLVRLSQAGQDAHGGPKPDAVYGGQLQTFALQNQPAEGKLKISWNEVSGQFADGSTFSLQKPQFELIEPGYGEFSKNILTSMRQSPILIGLGLLEQVSEAEILSWEDPKDLNRDGISGRANWVWDIEKKQKSVGRFGWKANQPTLKQQVAGAFAGDIGITNQIFPDPDFSHIQAEKLGNLPNGGNPELEDRLLDRVVFYTQNLAVPARREPERAEVKAGQVLFQNLKCQLCHRPAFELRKQELQAYSDLLLHDLGPELADQRPDYLATGQEWRTAPLWGLGLIEKVNGHSRYLHDGRARNLEEAILWHGGEAQGSRENYQKLSAEQRKNLIRFIQSL